MHPLYDALPEPYVTVQVTRGAMVAHRYTYGPPRYRISQYTMTFIPLSESLWNDLADPVFSSGARRKLFKSKAKAFFVLC